MASSVFAQAIDALVAERDRQFCLRIAQDYGLNFEELNAKYLETAAAAIKVPRKYKKREPKAVNVVEVAEGGEAAAKPAKAPKEPKTKQCCTAQTSKKEPCKFSALKGEVFCKRHLKQSLGESAPAEPKAKKAPKAAKKAAEPVHTHAMDAEIHSDCELCESHGNPLAEEIVEFEVAPQSAHTGPVKPVSVSERLAAMLAEADESASESGDDAGDLGEEEFEDEDD